MNYREAIELAARITKENPGRVECTIFPSIEPGTCGVQIRDLRGRADLHIFKYEQWQEYLRSLEPGNTGLK